MPAPDAHVEDLLETANASSGIARTAWITFLGFAAYFLVIIGATTHRQLLLGSPVELPILGVDLPLFDFYRYAPALFLLLHLNLLLQLDGLAAKLFRFDAALKRSSMQRADKEKVRARLHPFLFTRMLVGAPMGSVQRALIGLSVWSTVVIGPVILLLACQIRFLPYHAVDMTWWHRIVILLDLAMLWLLWPAILHPSNTAAGAWRGVLAMPRDSLVALWRFGRLTGLRLRAAHKRGIPPGPIIQKRVRAAFGLYRRTREDLQSTYGALLLFAGSLLSLLFCLVIATVPDEGIERWIVDRLGPSRQLGQIWQVCVEPPVAGEFPREARAMPCITAELFEGAPDPVRQSLYSPFSRNLVLMDADLVDEADLTPGQRSLSLRGRDLRYAILDRADLRHVDFVAADLTGASLRGAKLDGADLGCVDPERRIGCARLEGADFTGALLGSSKAFLTGFTPAAIAER